MNHLAFVAIGISVLAFAGGLALMSVMFDWLPDPQFTEIKPGSNFASLEIEGRADGHLDLWFKTNEADVRALLFEEEEYAKYLSGEATQSIFSVEGYTADYSSRTDKGYLRLVFERIGDDSSSAVEVAYLISVTGIIVEYLTIAVVAAVAGSGLVVFGLWKEFAKDRRRTRSSP